MIVFNVKSRNLVYFFASCAVSAIFIENSSLFIIIRPLARIPDVAKAMEPLFTTGGEERAGLGFAVMQSFCDSVRVISKPQKGTTVTLTKRFERKPNGE